MQLTIINKICGILEYFDIVTIKYDHLCNLKDEIINCIDFINYFIDSDFNETLSIIRNKELECLYELKKVFCDVQQYYNKENLKTLICSDCNEHRKDCICPHFSCIDWKIRIHLQQGEIEMLMKETYFILKGISGRYQAFFKDSIEA